MARALGIDFGGTKILAGVVDTDTGEILSQAKKRTRSEQGGDDIFGRLLDVAKEALQASGTAHHDVQKVGIGVAGQVDRQKGELIRAPNLPNELLGTAIVERVHDALKLPVTLANDVVAAAAGEAAFGSGKGQPDFVCIFIGTGIGGAIYQGGQPYRGATSTAGELGHMVIEQGGRVCGCGGLGHLEAYASRTAIVRTVLGAMRQGRRSSLETVDPNPNPDDPAHSPIRSKALAEAVRLGDALAISMVTNAARYMAAGLVSIVNFYNPPRIILGGGVVDAVNLYFDVSSALLQQEALQVPRQSVEIVKSGLGDFSGIVGAAVLGSVHA
jgi:glucokinase